MSDDDGNPSDDELEREASRENPLAKRHAPKLSEESRALNLNDLRSEYGIERQQPEPPHAPVVPIPFERINAVARDRRLADAARGQRGLRDPVGADMSAAASTPLRSRLGQMGTSPNSGSPYRDGPPSLTPREAADLWDRAYDAALPLVVGLAETSGQAADLAGQFADLKLEERRRRFG